MLEKTNFALIALFVATAGCASIPYEQSAWQDESPLGRGLETFRPSEIAKDYSAEVFEELTGELTLRDALAAAMLQSPDLAATAYEVRAREAEVIQAGLGPNPELAFEFENFGGSNSFSGTDSMETTLAMSQLIELGGKRMKRSKVAQYQADIAGWEYEVRRIDVLSKTTADYIGLLAAIRQHTIASDSFSLAQRVYDAINIRVEAGKVPTVQLAKAEVERSQAALNLSQAVSDVEIARHRLASNWGSVSPSFDSITGNLNDIEKTVPLDVLISHIEQNPDVARWATETAYRNAEVELALAGRTASPTVSFGARRFNDSDETVFVAGLSFPLLIADQNQGNIRAARMRALQTSKQEAASRVQVRTAVTGAYLTIDAALRSVETIQEHMLPSAEVAFAAAEEAFRVGKIDALHLFDSQRTLFASRRQLVDALTTYHLAIIAGERLIGSPLHDREQPKGNDQ